MAGPASSTVLRETNEDNDSLHIAARSGQKEIVLQILSRRPDLIYHKNTIGDNPLHVAAEAGQLGIVELLIAFFKSHYSSQSSGSTENKAEEIPSVRIDVDEITNSVQLPQGSDQSESRAGNIVLIEPIWKTKNHDGSTALHEALRNKHEDVALYLLDVDSEAVEFANDKNESPLYLAAKAGYVRVLNIILEAGRKPCTDGPKGQTPFHAAVFAKSQESIEVLYGSIAEIINEQDSHGKTALYYATQEDSLEIMCLLLELDPSSALKCDKEGLSPLLVAAKQGRSASVLAILNACPDSTDSSDNNGRNALHLAVTHNTIKRFETLLSFPELNDLAKERDKEGNTPLHLAAMAQEYHHVLALLCSTNVTPEAENNNGQKAFDLLHADGDLSYEQRLIRDALNEGSTFHRRRLMRSRSIKPPEVTQDKDLSQTINSMSVVAALIATITFSAALQIPGGYNSDGSPTLIHKAAFKAFVVTDGIAFCLSVLTLSHLLIASAIKDSSDNVSMLIYAGSFLVYALLSSMMAFFCGLYVVMSIESKLVTIFVSVTSSYIVLYVILMSNSELRQTILEVVPKIN